MENEALALELLHGDCRACKNKPTGPYIPMYSPIRGMECKPLANGPCAVCVYAGKTMILPPNNIQQDKDNWVWMGEKEG